jgi:hypothetical protein
MVTYFCNDDEHSSDVIIYTHSHSRNKGKGKVVPVLN